jgi:cell wall-associated NlpC family hydrolase
MKGTVQCDLAAIPMRAEPTDKAEMVNQMLLGETAAILDEVDNNKGGGWYMLRLQHDGYEGWVDKKQVQPIANAVKTNPVSQLFAQNANGIVAPCGSLVAEHEEKRHVHSIEEIAKQFLGSPYLWGGRTFMGIDCSGYTQMVFRVLGENIPRDAWQQAEKGSTITFVEEAQTGDLAFFDNTEGRIIHVGIVLRDKNNDTLQIIHASGQVRIDALDHQGIFNSTTKSYSHNLRLIKRI